MQSSSLISPSVSIIETGRANIASVEAAFRRLGFTPQRTKDPDVIKRASHVVLPGVGAFGAAITALRELKLDSALQERFDRNLPTLCICLGLQLLCRSSAETPGASGLGFIPDPVERFESNNPIPQLGWNLVEPSSALSRIARGHAYFANSYCLKRSPDGWVAAWSDYGERFVSAVERGNWLACQFHPELSGPWGESLLARWAYQATEPL